jgi:hypothetical protein
MAEHNLRKARKAKQCRQGRIFARSSTTRRKDGKFPVVPLSEPSSDSERVDENIRDNTICEQESQSHKLMLRPDKYPH